MWAPNEEYEHDVLVPDLRIDLQEQGNPLVILGSQPIYHRSWIVLEYADILIHK